MGLRMLVAAAAVTAVALALTGCAAAAAPAPGSPTPAAAGVTAIPTPTPTPTTVWQDPEKLIMPPYATTPAMFPHGPSWATQDGSMKCGIYDDWPRAGNLGPGVYYGCRIEDGDNRFTYPPVQGQGEIGGCPSGFAAYAGEAPTALCNSGQVFASETGSPTVLMPGDGVRFAGVECVALAVGMSCTDTASGHGFRVTLDDYSLD